jgi:type III secretory pathway component EscT
MNLDGEALVFARTIGFLSRAPGFSNKAVSPFIRAGFAFTFTLLIGPTIQANVQMRDGSLLFSLISEVAIGAIVGYACSTLYLGVDAGSQALDDFVGIKGSNPTLGPMGSNGIARLWSYVFTTAYFVLGGYMLVLQVFAEGLHTLPPGAAIDPTRWLVFVDRFPQLVMQAAISIAGPALLIGMLTQFALAAVSRIVPRFSVQSITFGVTFGVVVLVTIAVLPLAMSTAAHPWIPLLPGIGQVGHR